MGMRSDRLLVLVLLLLLLMRAAGWVDGRRVREGAYGSWSCSWSCSAPPASSAACGRELGEKASAARSSSERVVVEGDSPRQVGSGLWVELVQSGLGLW